MGSGLGVCVEQVLSAAGWSSGRVTDLAVTQQQLQQSGFTLHDAARRFLTEYQGLAVDVPITGVERVGGFVHFSPEMVTRLLAPQDFQRISDLIPKSACPVGTTGGHTMFIFMDEDGRTYLLDMEWTLFAKLAESHTEMIRVLCDGRNGRVDSSILDDQGRQTRQVIREGAERQHWQLDQFQALARYMPPVSLSPARRPPTWRAMVRAAEAQVAQRGSPSGILITCGGFASAPNGQMYFVAHCENCLYVRSKAGFLITPPPPGIPAQFRAGEVIPFQRPPGW
jgi:hypothetical protein